MSSDISRASPFPRDARNDWAGLFIQIRMILNLLLPSVKKERCQDIGIMSRAFRELVFF
jgi:hypothetical protein